MTVRRDDRNPKKWIIDFYYDADDCVRKRFKRRSLAVTKTAAEAEERRLRNYIAEHGEPPRSSASKRPKRRAFGEVAREYLGAPAKTRLKTSTYRSYKRRLEKNLIPSLGHLAIGKIGTAEWSKFDAVLLKAGASPASRRNARIVFQAVRRYAEEAGYVDQLPRLPKPPKVRRKQWETVTAANVLRIIGSCRCDEHKLVVMLAGYAGLRAGEVRGLRWKDVYLDAGYLVVRQSICHGVADVPKGKERKVPLVPELQSLLGKTKERNSQGLVARSKTGKPWSEYAPANAFRRARDRAKLAGIRYHDLRHFFTTTWLNSGVPVHVVMEVVGHADLSTTQIYAHVTDDDLKLAVAKVSGPHLGTMPLPVREETAREDEVS